MITGGNNKQTYADFIASLKMKQVRRSVLVMDNLSVHKAKLVKSLFDRDFECMYLPPYSC